ncbi:MAG: TonB-dependent receptor [Bacilli bacterium]|nr:TonB-dependent receptor [Bacilli bacterium]
MKKKKPKQEIPFWNFRKFLRMIKLVFVCLLLGTNMMWAGLTYSQATTLNLNLNNVELEKVFDAIRQQSEFEFFYNNDQVNTSTKVSIKSKDADITEVLDQILPPTYEYKINDRYVQISRRKDITHPPLIQVHPQQTKKIISGKAVDQYGDAVIGANIIEKGTSNGIITDFKGNFSLAVSDNAILQISYIGFISQEITVGNKSHIQITLLEDVKMIDELVVIGYGTMKKSDLTGAVMSANLKDFEKSPNTNLMQSLQGTVPGLNIGQVTSAGSTPSITIRGRNTISGNSDILIVLDGVIFNGNISSINPSDIESVDILKDASATAVYGAQAANGVMMITSKKGKVGKAKITFTSSYSLQNPTKNYKMMNREQYLNNVKSIYYNEAYTQESGYTTLNSNFNVGSKLPDSYQTDEYGNPVDTDFDWWDTATRQGSILENQISIMGGTEKTSYLFSYGNTQQKNFLLNDDFKRHSIRLNLDTEVRKWWKLGVQAFGSFMNYDGAEPTLWTLLSMNPMATPYNEDGSLNPLPMETNRSNPLMGSDVDDRDRNNSFFANIYSEIQLPLKGLTFRINLGQNYRINENFRSNPYGSSLSGEAYKRHRSYYDYSIDNILTYSNIFGDHDINGTFVYGAIERKESYTDATANTFSRMTLGYNSLEQGTNQYTSSDAWDEALLYQMIRASYKYDNRYLLTATLRRDGFSGFSANNKFALFPSVSLGWLLFEEPFFDISWVDQLKLRAGYGVSGNLTSRYKSLAQVDSEIGYLYGDESTGALRQELTTLGNNDLKWEKTGGINLGLDFALFKSRINGALELYRTVTRDLLYDVTIPSVTGFTSIASNVGKVENKGIEFSISSRNIVSKDFEWSTTFNISSNKNKILSLIGDNDGDGKEDDLIASNLFVGQPITAIYGYKIEGIYQIDDTNIPTGFQAGHYKVKNMDDNEKITEADRTVIGNADPKYRFGILNKFTYKDFSLSFFINSAQGGSNGYLGENTASRTPNDTEARSNSLYEKAKLFWSPSNSGGIYSHALSTSPLDIIRYESRSFVRLQEVTLTYNLPKKWITQLGIDNASFYINGKNLLTFTDWHGWDPEPESIDYSDFTDSTLGSNFDSRPVMRSFTFGLNVSF